MKHSIGHQGEVGDKEDEMFVKILKAFKHTKNLESLNTSDVRISSFYTILLITNC